MTRKRSGVPYIRQPSGISTTERVGEHGSTAMYQLGCRCDVCRVCNADRLFGYRLREKLERMRTEGYEEWEIDLERIALELRRYRGRRVSA